MKLFIGIVFIKPIVSLILLKNNLLTLSTTIVLEKQLHNDLLAFSVERGLLGVLGLVMLAGVAVSRAVWMLQIGCKYPRQTGFTAVVFLATFAAVLVVSLTHQVFHSREIWLVLASQEAMLAHYERVPAIAVQETSLMQSLESWRES